MLLVNLISVSDVVCFINTGSVKLDDLFRGTILSKN